MVSWPCELVEDTFIMYVTPKPFYFMRHGETDWNIKNLYMGAQDIPLNDNGFVQAEQAYKILENQELSAIVTSPLLRTLDTARVLSDKLKVPLIVMDNFKQCCWGDREGKPFDNGRMIKDWLNGYTPEGAETSENFHQRIQNGLDEVFQMKGTVLIISHGGVYRAIRRILGIPIRNVNHCAPVYHTPPTPPSLDWQVSMSWSFWLNVYSNNKLKA